MESNNVKFTDPATFTTELIARLTSLEKMAAFKYHEKLRNRGYMDDLEKLIRVTGLGAVAGIVLTLRNKRDVITSFHSGEPIRMVMLSNGLLIALKRHRDELNEDEIKILEEVYDLLNILI